MRTVFIGQRVRLARPVQPENLGAEGVIRKIFPAIATAGGHMVNCKVRWDRAVIGNASHTDQLEPILPEGAAPSEYTAEELFDKLGINVEEGETV